MRSQYGSRSLLLLLVVGLFSVSLGQPRGSRAVSDFGQRVNRRGIPDWENDVQFKHDLFTFVRIRYDSWRSRNKWATDYPDSDLNFSFRLQQLTSLKVHPDGKVLTLHKDGRFGERPIPQRGVYRPSPLWDHMSAVQCLDPQGRLYITVGDYGWGGWLVRLNFAREDEP